MKAFDYQGRTIRISELGVITIDRPGGRKMAARDEWDEKEQELVRKFFTIPNEDRQPHRRCDECHTRPAACGRCICATCRCLRRDRPDRPKQKPGRKPRGVCNVEGCGKPQHQDKAGKLRPSCLEHWRQYMREYRGTSKASLRYGSGDPVSKQAMPYNWRNCRPGSMSEALRIDTGGER